MTKTSTCKFCGVPVTVELEAGHEMFGDLKWWASLAACNRCADHRMRVLRMSDHARAMGLRYIANYNGKGGEKSETAIAQIREAFEKLSKRLVSIVASHYRTQNYWDSGWLEVFTESPDKIQRAFLVHDDQARRTFLKERDQQHAEQAT